MDAATTRYVSQHNHRSQNYLSRMIRNGRPSIGWTDAQSLSRQKMTLFMLISSDFRPVRLSTSEKPVLMAARSPIFVAGYVIRSCYGNPPAAKCAVAVVHASPRVCGALPVVRGSDAGSETGYSAGRARHPLIAEFKSAFARVTLGDSAGDEGTIDVRRQVIGK
jgi:hypothetical protein